MTELTALTQLPIARFVEASKMAHQPQMESFNAAKWLCDWWNQESQCQAELRCAGGPDQKKLRDRLRIDVGFYISDFSRSNAGFTAADFDGRGTIKII
ncbi:hypothetical protein LJR296_007985 [Cupriavidus necator]|uniref:hypothetical protein n=1 Tax=Cupriavidus necator TaxID=106590 RepID=UPI003ED16D30